MDNCRRRIHPTRPGTDGPEPAGIDPARIALRQTRAAAKTRGDNEVHTPRCRDRVQRYDGQKRTALHGLTKPLGALAPEVDLTVVVKTRVGTGRRAWFREGRLRLHALIAPPLPGAVRCRRDRDEPVSAGAARRTRRRPPPDICQDRSRRSSSYCVGAATGLLRRQVDSRKA